MYISTLEFCKSHYAQWERNYLNLPDSIAAGGVACAAGGSAAAFAQLIGVPIDIVSQHRMLQQDSALPAARESPAAIARRILRTEGLRGLYRGYHVSVLTYAPSSAMMWGSHAVYSRALDYALPLPAAPDVGGIVDPFDDPALGRDLGVAGAAGVAAGVTTAWLTNPLDVLRARLQTESSRSTVRAVVRDLVNQYGRFGWLTRGASARAMAMGPTTGIIMTMYQVLKRSAYEHSDE